MRWRDGAGQAALEAALVLPLLLLLLLGTVTFGYWGVAQLLVISGAGQGARLGAALCGDGKPAGVVVQQSRERVLSVLSPLAGPKDAASGFDGSDLVVTARFTYRPPLPGAAIIFGSDAIPLTATARYRCDA